MRYNYDEMYVAPRPGWVRLTDAEADRLRGELHELSQTLAGADQGKVFLTPAQRLRLEERRRTLKRALADAERSSTTENADDRRAAARNVPPTDTVAKLSAGARALVAREAKKLNRRIAENDATLRELRATAAGISARSEGADDGAAYAAPRPYWQD